MQNIIIEYATEIVIAVVSAVITWLVSKKTYCNKSKIHIDLVKEALRDKEKIMKFVGEVSYSDSDIRISSKESSVEIKSQSLKKD